MMCYRDQTFCKESKCKEFGDGPEKCFRSFTEKVAKEAQAWWGKDKEDGGPPVAFFSDQPECFKK